MTEFESPLPGPDDAEVSSLINIAVANIIEDYRRILASRGCKDPSIFSLDDSEFAAMTLSQILRKASDILKAASANREVNTDPAHQAASVNLMDFPDPKDDNRADSN